MQQRLSNESRGGAGLILPGWGQDALGLVIPEQYGLWVLETVRYIDLSFDKWCLHKDMNTYGRTVIEITD